MILGNTKIFHSFLDYSNGYIVQWENSYNNSILPPGKKKTKKISALYLQVIFRQRAKYLIQAGDDEPYMLSCAAFVQSLLLPMYRDRLAQIVCEFSKNAYRQNNHNPVSARANQRSRLNKKALYN